MNIWLPTEYNIDLNFFITQARTRDVKGAKRRWVGLECIPSFFLSNSFCICICICVSVLVVLYLCIWNICSCTCVSLFAFVTKSGVFLYLYLCICTCIWVFEICSCTCVFPLCSCDQIQCISVFVFVYLYLLFGICVFEIYAAAPVFSLSAHVTKSGEATSHSSCTCHLGLNQEGVTFAIRHTFDEIECF